jgi:hypothetical protein
MIGTGICLNDRRMFTRAFSPRADSEPHITRRINALLAAQNGASFVGASPPPFGSSPNYVPPNRMEVRPDLYNTSPISQYDP